MPCTVDPAVHGGEHVVVDVLDRHVEVVADLRFASDQFDQPVADPVRIGVEQAQPAQTVDLDQRFEQVDQVGAILAIGAEGGDILGDQVDLLDPAGDQRLDFSHHRGDAARAQGAANARDHAVGAVVGAALGNLHVSGVVRRGEDARGGMVVEEVGEADGPARPLPPQVLVEQFDDARRVGGADEQVDLGEFRRQFVPVALGKAAAHHQQLAAAAALPVGHLEDGVDRLFLGLADEGSRC